MAVKITRSGDKLFPWHVEAHGGIDLGNFTKIIAHDVHFSGAIGNLSDLAIADRIEIVDSTFDKESTRLHFSNGNKPEDVNGNAVVGIESAFFGNDNYIYLIHGETRPALQPTPEKETSIAIGTKLTLSPQDRPDDMVGEHVWFADFSDFGADMAYFGVWVIYEGTSGMPQRAEVPFSSLKICK